MRLIHRAGLATPDIEQEQHCSFGSALPLKNRILYLKGNLPPVWEPMLQARCHP